MGANYLILKDSSVRAPGPIDIYLPEDADPARRIILAFEVNPSDGADFDYSIEILHHWIPDEDVRPDPGFEGGFLEDPDRDYARFVIKEGHFSGGVRRGMWEVFDASQLTRNGPPFQVPGQEDTHDRGQYFQRVWFLGGGNGDGHFNVSDVVLWYKVR